MERLYLERICIGAYGRLYDAALGPLSPGLNVVYGKNESGKTTLASFVGGVLYGWEDARGSRNVYKPAGAQRHGSLIFRSVDTGQTIELSRERNVDGLQADPSWGARILEGVEKETFRTFFSLDADELRGLDCEQGAAARLLTASSGTQESPAWALERLDERIATLQSRAAGVPYSFPNLKKAKEECRAAIAEARAQSDACKKEAHELQGLEARIARQGEELARMHAEIETLAACQTSCARCDQETLAARTALEAARQEYTAVAQQRRTACAAYEGVPHFDLNQERHAAALIAQFEQERAAHERRVQEARDAFEAARAQLDADTVRAARARRPAWNLALAACLCGVASAVLVVLVSIGAQDAFVRAAGILTLAVAAGAAILAAYSALRRKRAPHVFDDGRETLAASKSILDQRVSELAAFDGRVAASLDALGLAAAGGSLASARSLLEVVREARAIRAVFSERRSAAADRMTLATARLGSLAHERAEALAAAGFDAQAPVAAVEQRRMACVTARDELQASLQEAHARAGELRRILSEAEASHGLDRLKIERAQLATREKESAQELAMLLLARRGLQEALDRWKKESQPEVYARASKLMSLLTQGAWIEVLADEGEGVAVADALHRRRAPKLLSMGTRQQLYLALRIALLETQAEVGASLPVFADDILVNFDDERRSGAVAALADLARFRQVVVFTCHREVMEAFARHAGEHAVLAL